MATEEQITERGWTKMASDVLVGKTIKSVEYLSISEMEHALWYNRPLVITFNDGSILIPQTDDEGNDGGALYYYDTKGNVNQTIPVL
jgi:hypothetical protein